MKKHNFQNNRVFILVLHNIRSVYNVGSLFRTSDGAGIAKIILTGITPTPVDRFGRKRTDFAKVALGAEETVPWEYVKDPLEVLACLKGDGFYLTAVEQDAQSVDYKELSVPDKTAIILGSETDGLSEDILDTCDVVVEIPMHGKKESLNVSVAGGIAIFSLLT